MYRVRVDNRWLPWVSNAEPEWMRKVHAQYNLDGTLDTESYYAGNKGQNINGVEIRIFEENGTDITPTGKSKIIKTPHLNQHDEGYPTGCEVAKVLRGKSIPSLCSEYIDNNIPVIFWATDSMKPSYLRDPWTVNGKTIRWISPMHCLLLVGYDDYHYIFNDPLKRTEVTYYRKELVETAYKALNQQAVVIVKNPPDELIAKKKKQKFVETLNLFGVSGENIDTGAFGLFRSSSYDVHVKEELPGIEITYSCGFATSLGYAGKFCTIDVEGGKMILTNDQRTYITTVFSDERLGKKEPLIALEHVAAEIGNGRIIVGIRVRESTIALYYTVSFDVAITDFYKESMNVTIEFRIKPYEGPLLEPEYVYDFETGDAAAWLMASFVVVAAAAAFCGAPEFVILILAL